MVTMLCPTACLAVCHSLVDRKTYDNNMPLILWAPFCLAYSAVWLVIGVMFSYYAFCCVWNNHIEEDTPETHFHFWDVISDP